MNIEYSNEIRKGDLFPTIKKTVEFAYRKLNLNDKLKISCWEPGQSISFSRNTRRIILPADEFEITITKNTYPGDFRFIILHEVAHAMQSEKGMLSSLPMKYKTDKIPEKLKCELSYRDDTVVFLIDHAHAIANMHIQIWQNSQKFLFMKLMYERRYVKVWYRFDNDRSLEQILTGKKFAMNVNNNNDYYKIMKDESTEHCYNDLPWEKHANETAEALLPELLKEYPDMQWPESILPYVKQKSELEEKLNPS